MSPSRRTSGEINILAMLDGQATGRLSKRLRGVPVAAWYGAAGVLACSLLVAVAWLVRGAAPERDTDTGATAQASLRSGLAAGAPPPALAPAPAPVSLPALPTVPVESTAQPDAPAPTRGAVIIDLVAQPALAKLPAGAPAAALPAPAASAAAVRAATPSAAPAHPGGMPASQPQPGASRHAITTPPIRPRSQQQHRQPQQPPQPALRTMPSPAPSLARAVTTPARRKRTGAAAKTPPSAGVDTDVALISAILQHTGTRNEAADAGATAPCTEKSCRARMPSRQ